MTLASTLATTPSGTTPSGDDSPGPWDDSIVLVEPWVGVEAPGDISSSDVCDDTIRGRQHCARQGVGGTSSRDVRV